MKNIEQVSVTIDGDDDVFDPNRGKKYRDELAKDLRGARANPETSSGGRMEAKGLLDYSREYDPRYISANEEHKDDLRKKSEARARIVADFLKDERDSVPNKEYRLDKQQTLEAFRALDAAVRDGITSYSHFKDTLPYEMMEDLNRREYDIPALEDYINSCSKKAGRLSAFLELRKELTDEEDVGYDKFNAVPRNYLTDYEKKNGLTDEERKEKLRKLFERFKIVKKHGNTE